MLYLAAISFFVTSLAFILSPHRSESIEQVGVSRENDDTMLATNIIYRERFQYNMRLP